MLLGNAKCHSEIAALLMLAYHLDLNCNTFNDFKINLMKSIIHLMFSLICSSAIAQLSTADSTALFNKQLKLRSFALLEECISFNEVVGITAGIYKDGNIFWEDAAGQMDVENNTPAQANMIHRIASISKPMTAIAILQLMEKDLLDLDDPIQKYISDFPLKKEGTITIRHLLQHSSGIKAYKNGKESFPTKNYPTLRKAVQLFEDRDLANAPGEGYQYTTYGYVVLGVVIEKVSGLSYRDYMKQHIWEKAGMINTDVEVFGKHYPGKSKLYTINKKGEFETDKNTNLSVKVPGGGIQSTVADLLKFAEAVIEDKLINAESRKLMTTDSGMKKEGNPYGLGWFLYSDADKPSGRIIGHSGSQSGTSTQLFVFLDKKAAIAVISNTSGAWNNVFSLTDKLADPLVRPEDVNKPIRKVAKISTEILDRYVGKYKFESGTVVELTRKDEAFYGETNGGGKFRIYPESDTHFFLRIMNVQVEFETSTEKAKQFTFIQNGERHLAVR